MPSKDIKTQGIVLRRTNYGEADRILNIITPLGKFGVIARGVRKPRSKLAGGVEIFTLADLQIHRGRSELGILTSARMVKHYSEILKNYELMQLAGILLKRVATMADMVENEEFFDITIQMLEELNNGTNPTLVETWFWLNMMRASGEEVNFYRDHMGDELISGERYDWDTYQEVFIKNSNGKYGENEIKLLRLMFRVDLAMLRRVRINEDIIIKVYDIIKKWER